MIGSGLSPSHAAIVAFALPLFGCYDNGSSAYNGGYGSPNGPTACREGVDTGSVDAGALLDIDPGNGVGATVEYAGDGVWRFAVTCDTLLSGYPCYWRVLVSSIDGSIDSFEPEDLELDDVVEFYPSMAGSTVEDGVLLDSYADVGIDAFSVLATPGSGMRVTATIGADCGGPYLFWTEQADVRHSSTNPTDLYPSE